jgi:hypothetical protein
MTAASTTIPGYAQAVSPPGVNQYVVDLVYGKLEFNAANAGAAVTASYYNLGDDIMAEHVNELQGDIVKIETELGTDPAGAFANVKLRLEDIEASGVDGNLITDNTIRAGALMSDVKELSWNLTKDVLTDITAHQINGTDAHQASAIGLTAPGTTTFTAVQDHIDGKGSVTQTDTNAHGMALSDMPAGTGTIVGSATFQVVYSPNIESHNIAASGILVPTASGYVAGPSENQHVCVGTIGVPFASGNFDVLQASSYQTGTSSGATGTFTTTDGKTIQVINGLIVSIV